MRKILALVLLLSLLRIPGVYAADIPVQQGVVTDEAGLLTAQEAEAITRIAATDRYTLHVLTVDSLGGADPADYAEKVYHTWKLKTRDILLLIAYGDQQTEINFDNPELQNSLNAWSQNLGGASGSAAITKLLETYFNPYARDGDFALGISSVIKELQAVGSGPGSAAGGTAGGVQVVLRVADQAATAGQPEAADRRRPKPAGADYPSYRSPLLLWVPPYCCSCCTC